MLVQEIKTCSQCNSYDMLDWCGIFSSTSLMFYSKLVFGTMSTISTENTTFPSPSLFQSTNILDIDEDLYRPGNLVISTNYALLTVPIRENQSFGEVIAGNLEENGAYIFVEFGILAQ